jgi:hypothetical protein
MSERLTCTNPGCRTKLRKWAYYVGKEGPCCQSCAFWRKFIVKEPMVKKPTAALMEEATNARPD